MVTPTVTPGPFDGLWIVDLDVREDAERPEASFREVFHAAAMSERGLPAFRPVQWNISESRAGTLRGFHAEPWEKFVHVAHGEAFAAVADLRRGSPTAGAVWTGTLDRSRALFLERGLGNAFQALADPTVYAYLVNQHWQEDGTYPAVAWDDPDLGVSWPITDERLALSAKDGSNPSLAEHLGR
ncbi:MAG: dTDP-4-dehydrorhamnose 3,5-epimerase [Actinomycetota bacterium]